MVYKKLNSTETLIQRTTMEAPQQTYVLHWARRHKKTISYCIKAVSGQVQREGTIPATRTELDSWVKTLPKP